MFLVPLDEELKMRKVKLKLFRNPKVVYDEEGNEFSLSDIEDDEEWERVADAWQELVDNEEI